MDINPNQAPFDLPTPEQYQAFVEDTELRGARLVHSETHADRVVHDTSEVSYNIEVATRFAQFAEGFEAVQDCTISFFEHLAEDDEKETVGRVNVAYGFFYETDTDRFDEDLDAYLYIFERVSLPVNAWPFIRQFVHDMTQRMGWPPLMLPLLKEDSEEEANEVES